jgi:putative aldouronate transport system permease protein
MATAQDNTRPQSITGVGPLTLPATKRRRRNSARPIWMEEPGPLMKAAKFLALAFVTIVMLFPMVYVVAVSFSSAKDVLGGGLILFPRNPTLESYRAILEGGVVTRALQISIVLTLIGTAAQMAVTATLAYGLSRPTVWGSKFVLWVVLGALIFQPGMIPLYLLIRELGLINSYGSLILPGLVSAWNLIIVRNFFMNIPAELTDAAKIDGASDPQIFLKIILPLSKAVLAVIALFYGVGIWNAWFNALLYLNDSTMWPVQNVLRTYVTQGTSIVSPDQFAPGQAPPPGQAIQMAVVVLGTLPILIVYPFLQRFFTKGVLTGSIKG